MDRDAGDIWRPYLPPDDNEADPRRRLRRDHKKSRKGCTACKRRRVRCDERLPICSNCLVRGDSCEYPTPWVVATAEQQLGQSSAQEARSSVVTAAAALTLAAVANSPGVPAVVAGSRIDPFGSMEIDMPGKSDQLLQHFLDYRNELRRLVLSRANIDDHHLPAKYTVNPGYNRSMLLMAAKHHYGLTGRCEWADEPTFLHHKTEVIRLLKSQIDTNPTNPGDWSLSVILFLISMESLHRNSDAAKAHLMGLLALLKSNYPQEEGIYAPAYTLLRLSFLFLCLLEGAKKAQNNPQFNPRLWRDTNSPYSLRYSWEWANVAYLFSLMVGEFLVRDTSLLAAKPSQLSDLACLKWLVHALRTRRLAAQQKQQQEESARPRSRRGSPPYEDTQEKHWVVAGTCYALLLASLAEPPALEPAEGDPEAAVELGRIHDWWAQMTRMWIENPALPPCGVALDALDKIAFLTSEKGERVVDVLHGNCAAQIEARVR